MSVYVFNASAALNSSPSIPPIKPRSSPKPSHSHNSSAATQPTGDNLYMNVPEHTVTAMPTPSSSNSLGNDFGDERGDDDDDDDDVYTNDNLYATFRASSPQLDRVQRALVDRLASDQLPEEFKVLNNYLFRLETVFMLKTSQNFLKDLSIFVQ